MYVNCNNYTNLLQHLFVLVASLLILHCVFHGIRFKVIGIGCRDDNRFLFLISPKIKAFQTSVFRNLQPKDFM